jgi:hypothetical protein
MTSQAAIDTELESVKAAILKLDPHGSRTAQVLRDTFDQLYDGQRTGRYRLDQLYKTEKLIAARLLRSISTVNLLFKTARTWITKSPGWMLIANTHRK